MSSVSRSVDFSRSGAVFALCLLLALVAFWPSYLSLPFSASSRYTHLHATAASLWMLLLIAQPLAIRLRHTGCTGPWAARACCSHP